MRQNLIVPDIGALTVSVKGNQSPLEVNTQYRELSLSKGRSSHYTVSTTIKGRLF